MNTIQDFSGTFSDQPFFFKNYWVLELDDLVNEGDKISLMENYIMAFENGTGPRCTCKVLYSKTLNKNITMEIFNRLPLDKFLPTAFLETSVKWESIGPRKAYISNIARPEDKSFCLVGINNNFVQDDFFVSGGNYRCVLNVKQVDLDAIAASDGFIIIINMISRLIYVLKPDHRNVQEFGFFKLGGVLRRTDTLRNLHGGDALDL